MAYIKCLRNVITYTIPDGKTVTPTDVVATWLACGSRTEGYTTLSAVLADSTCLNALMASDNAVDYLVRSTTFASDITSDSGAMAAIGLNNYCANTLIDDADWLNSICKSTYFESVLNVENPTMTTPTTPSGVVYASGDENGWRARAFNKNNTAHYSGWTPGTQAQANDYLGYQFASAKRIVMCRILTYTESAISRTGIVQKSADNITWDNTDSYCYIGSGYNDKIQILPFANANDLAYYRVYFNGPLFSAHNYSAYVDSITFYGREDV